MLSSLLPALALSQAIPTPKSYLGFEVCDDYHLANYKQLTEYWQMLDKASDRVEMVSIGKTEFGREQHMLVISSPENIKKRETYRQRSETLARARTIKTNEQARAYIKDSKAVVWIDGGLHATETLCPQMLIEQAYQFASRKDEEMMRILDNCIILLVHANPDGMDLVSDWYMRRQDPRARELTGVPELYQKYCGHDNNRDFYALNMKESQNMSRQLYTVWYPQIMYNHHQSSPQGTIMFIPPFRNPFNFHVDPLIQVATDTVGMHMHQRLISEGKGGTVMRNGAGFSTWWNGGLRTTTYFHNMVGILTETWGSPNPGRVPFLKNRQVPSIDIPMPIDPGEWHLKQSLDYSISANMAILDYASRYREHVMFNTWRSARNAIEKGSKDSWIRYPKRIEADGEAALKDPKYRDARAYVIPANQADFKNAAHFMLKLAMSGVEIEQLKAPLKLDAVEYPVGSFVIRCDQAYRAHVMDMFEPQDYPNDFQYPGGPPNPPYDNAGYTLAFQMGVQFTRVLDPVAMETEPAAIPAVLGRKGIQGNVTSQTNWFAAPATVLDSYRAANTLMGKGITVYRVPAGTPDNRNGLPVGGTFLVSASDLGLDGMKILADSGEWTALNRAIDARQLNKLRPKRIGLVDRYGGSMPSGWTRFVLEQHNFPFQVIFAPDIDKGNLHDRFDVILVPSGFSFSRNVTRNNLLDDPTIPQMFKDRMGTLSSATSEPALKKFVEQGGHLVLVGDASNMGMALGAPIESVLEEKNAEGRMARLPQSKFYVPASVLRMQLDPNHTLTMGMSNEVDAMFDDNTTYRIKEGASNVARVGWFDDKNLLRSGWAWGQDYLKNSTTLIDAGLGEGKLVILSPEVTFRAQPTGTYRLVFNALMR